LLRMEAMFQFMLGGTSYRRINYTVLRQTGLLLFFLLPVAFLLRPILTHCTISVMRRPSSNLRACFWVAPTAWLLFHLPFPAFFVSSALIFHRSLLLSGRG